eukprot:TRINITY_DN13755_c0_g1_i2.p1 TRINITY_DN13755_c0_g1~~TRINITY_DN13755_c0_g1_i2.p1  ORF type:complete len:1211 (+),score=301.84 TRINITY_DN13755_c0_g1_i2:261-3893(+)
MRPAAISSKSDAISVPGAKNSKLAGLFDDDDETGADAFVAAPAAAVAAQAGAASTQESRKIVWSGLTRLFRLDDAGSEMVEVDAGEGRDGFFGAVLRSIQGDAGQFELLVYTAVKKRTRLRMQAAVLELQPLSGESLPFYDDNGIYWALQLEQSGESEGLMCLLLAAKALGTGSVASVDRPRGTFYEQDLPATTLRLTSASYRSLTEKHDQPLDVLTAPSVQASQLPGAADSQWGAGVGEVLAAACAGSVTLLAVPPLLQPVSFRSQSQAEAAVLMLTIEGWEGEQGQALAPAEEQQKVSVKDRMARLAAAGLPPGAFNGAVHLAAAVPSDSGETSAHTSPQRPWHTPPQTAPPAGQPPIVPSSTPWLASQSLTSPAGEPSALHGHPSAEIIRQYWSAVRETGAATPYAYLGTLPFVPGLTRPPVVPEAAATSFARGPDMASTSHTVSSSIGAERAAVSCGFPSSTPLTAVSLGDLVSALRDVVRTEATPEGWQAERQKLERRVSLLEEQLRSSKVHQDQLREAMRSQAASLHAQIADSQALAQQMREQQVRSEGERQMREWERDAAKSALEAELSQMRAEVQQLLLERKSLQDRLTEAHGAQQRAESSASAASLAAASLPSTEARLSEQSQATAILRQQLLSLVAGRSKEAVAVSRGVLAVAYVGVANSLPNSPGAMVAADGVSQRLRTACRLSGRVLEQQLQLVQAAAAAWSPESGRNIEQVSDQIDWDAVESQTLSELGPSVLPDVGGEASAAASAAVEEVSAAAEGREAKLRASLASQEAQMSKLRSDMSDLQETLQGERANAKDLREKFARSELATQQKDGVVEQLQAQLQLANEEREKQWQEYQEQKAKDQTEWKHREDSLRQQLDSERKRREDEQAGQRERMDGATRRLLEDEVQHIEDQNTFREGESHHQTPNDGAGDEQRSMVEDDHARLQQAEQQQREAEEAEQRMLAKEQAEQQERERREEFLRRERDEEQRRKERDELQRKEAEIMQEEHRQRSQEEEEAQGTQRADAEPPGSAQSEAQHGEDSSAQQCQAPQASVLFEEKSNDQRQAPQASASDDSLFQDKSSEQRQVPQDKSSELHQALQAPTSDESLFEDKSIAQRQVPQASASDESVSQDKPGEQRQAPQASASKATLFEDSSSEQRRAQQASASKASLFEDDDEDVFAVKPQSVQSQKRPSRASVSSRKSIFDDDSDDDPFAR